MAYDETLAARIREVLVGTPGVSERKMFGGLAFMLDGHMCCGVVGSDLMVRLGVEGAGAALEDPHVRPMDFTGRPLATMVYVDGDGLGGSSLGRWVGKATDFAGTLPPKP